MCRQDFSQAREVSGGYAAQNGMLDRTPQILPFCPRSAVRHRYHGSKKRSTYRMRVSVAQSGERAGSSNDQLAETHEGYAIAMTHECFQQRRVACGGIPGYSDVEFDRPVSSQGHCFVTVRQDEQERSPVVEDRRYCLAAGE